MGPVLKAVIQTVVGMQEGVVSWRVDQERELKVVAKSLTAANDALYPHRTCLSGEWSRVAWRGVQRGELP